MPRYFAELAYDGTNYCGWQKQPHSTTVQQTIEENISRILKNKGEIVGCGRTDTGVHASQYFFHFDAPEKLTEKEVRSIIKIQPKDISIKNIQVVPEDAHARFSAITRRYNYYIQLGQNPFNQKYTYQYYGSKGLDIDKMNAASTLLLSYDAFFPFCKSGSEVDHYKCRLTKASWKRVEDQLIFDIQSNRFLRGMVRLIVGMCIMISEDKISVEDVKYSMDNQKRLVKDYSSPAQGLFLSEITYPEF